MELDYIKNLQAFFNEHASVFIALLSACFFMGLYIGLSRIAKDLFSLYKRQFYSQVDQGLRDVLILLDPSQVFGITIGVVVVIFPLFFFVTNLVVAAGVSALVLVAPPYVLKVLKNRRAEKFVKQLPDALSSMSSALKSGLNLVKTLQQVVRNQPQPLAQEFAQVLVEYRVGTDLNDSFSQLSDRIARPEVVLMNSAIRINRAVGGNLAETLDTLADTLREKTKIEGRIKALTAMGESQGRLAAAFPLLMGYVFYQQEPAAMSLLFTTILGWIWLAIMVVMAIVGVFLIKKIVNIDV